MDALKKFYVFGSFVSGVDEPRDADVFLVMANTVHSESRAPLLRASDSAVLLVLLRLRNLEITADLSGQKVIDLPMARNR
jgi:hypothetical protein